MGMNLTLGIFVMAIGVLFFTIIIYMLVKQKLNESNSILWLVIAFLTLLFGCFPELLVTLADFIGIAYQPTLLFLVATIVLLLIAFKSSLEISELSAKLNETAITLSILKEENKQLKEAINNNSVKKAGDVQ